MAPMLIALLASAVLANEKARQDQQNYKDMQKVEAAKQRFSAFTGQRGQTLGRPNSANTMMQSLIAGAMMGKQFQGGGGDQSLDKGSELFGATPQTGRMNGMNEDLYRPVV